MTALVPGANAPLSGTAVTATLAGAADLTALVVSADGRVAGDADMVFFNQPAAPGLALDGPVLTLDLGALRPGADKVVVVASPTGDGATFAGLPVSVRVAHGGGAVEFTPSGLGAQTVVVLVELYRRGADWKVRAVGQGYDTGLAGLAADFGVDVDDDVDSADGADSTSGGTGGGAPASPPPPDLVKAPLGRVELTKKGSATIPLDLSERGRAVDAVFRVDLDWDGGSADRRARGADLDLYALWADRDGATGVVYYRDLGSLRSAPFVELAGDSTTPGRETLRITRPDRLAHVLVCAYSAVENGTGSFRSYGARAVVDDAAGSTVTVPLFEQSERYWVAIALLSFTDTGVRVTQVEDYGTTTTERRPLLHPDGRFEMGAGPAEFKSR